MRMRDDQSRRSYGGLARRGGRLIAVALVAGATTVLSLVAAPAQAATAHTATSGPLSGLVKGFGCATPSGAEQVHCLGEMRAVRARNGRLAPLTMSGPVGYGP